MPNPMLPRSRTNPVGQTLRIRKAFKAINADLRRAQETTLGILDSIPVEARNAPSFFEYLIDASQLAQFVQIIRQALSNVGQRSVSGHVRDAYMEGTAKARENLDGLTDQNRDVSEVLSSRPVQQRAALVSAGALEQLEGFSGETATDLAGVLSRGIQDGANPRVVAREIRDRFGIARRRALRIARTEITTALRRGRWDEADAAATATGQEIKMLHISALLSTTRQTHAARHGRLFDTQEVREWYSQNGNSINCRCTQVEAVLDENGELISPKLKERLDEQRKAFTGK